MNNVFLPTDVHIPIPETWEYVTLHGKRDLSNVIKLRVLRWEITWVIWVDPSNHKGPNKGKSRQESKNQRRRCGDRNRSQREQIIV